MTINTTTEIRNINLFRIFIYRQYICSTWRCCWRLTELPPFRPLVLFYYYYHHSLIKDTTTCRIKEYMELSYWNWWNSRLQFPTKKLGSKIISSFECSVKVEGTTSQWTAASSLKIPSLSARNGVSCGKINASATLMTNLSEVVRPPTRVYQFSFPFFMIHIIFLWNFRHPSAPPAKKKYEPWTGVPQWLS